MGSLLRVFGHAPPVAPARPNRRLTTCILTPDIRHPVVIRHRMPYADDTRHAGKRAARLDLLGVRRTNHRGSSFRTPLVQIGKLTKFLVGVREQVGIPVLPTIRFGRRLVTVGDRAMGGTVAIARARLCDTPA